MSDAVAYAAAAADDMESLASLSSSLEAYAWPADVDGVVRELNQIARVIDLVLWRAADWIEGEHDEGQVGADFSRDPADVHAAVTAALTALASAAQCAAALDEALDRARQHTARLTGTP